MQENNKNTTEKVIYLSTIYYIWHLPGAMEDKNEKNCNTSYLDSYDYSIFINNTG